MSRRRNKTERGVALIMVLGTLALVGAVIGEFQYTSRVDLELAFNGRDAVQAEYNALSALRLRAMLLRHARRLDSGAAAAGAALGIDPQMMPPIGQLIEMIPVDCGLMSAIISETAGEEAPAGDESGGEVFAGECTATSVSEHAKISINVLARSSQGASQQVSTFLLGLLSNPALERHFDKDDRSGSHAESPVELVSAITDWIDVDNNQSVNPAADEDRLYEYLKDSYRAKNAPFDSLAELQLVHGISDELYDLLKEHVSIYSDNTQIELATASVEQIFVGLMGSLRQGSRFDELAIHPGTGLLFQAITEMRQLGGAGFAFLKVPTLVALIQQFGLDSLIDTNAVQQLFTDRQNATWYTLYAEGRVGNAGRRIRAVFQASEAQFYYVRIE
ncbi:MAG: general secretion pathway protein GspK [Deltaproteobacteria bacterium]|nr:general secretion pathway protein GspK [Deltaproteobacteria bacterium]